MASQRSQRAIRDFSKATTLDARAKDLASLAQKAKAGDVQALEFLGRSAAGLVDPELTVFASDLLSQVRTPGSSSPPRRAEERSHDLAKALASSDAATCRRAVTLAAHLHAVEHFARVADLAANAKDRGLQEEALAAVGRLGASCPEKAFDTLLAVWQKATPQTQAAVLHGLSLLPSREKYAVFFYALGSEHHPVADAARRFLSSIGRRRTIAQLERLLASSDPDDRVLAVGALAHVALKSDALLLAAAALQDTSEEVRERAEQILSKVPPAEVVAAFATAITVGIRPRGCRQYVDLLRRLEPATAGTALEELEAVLRCLEGGTEIPEAPAEPKAPRSPEHTAAITQILTACPAFRCLKKALLARCVAKATLKKRSAGEIHIHAGDVGQKLYVISSGRLALCTVGAESKRPAFQARGPGELDGETGVLQSCPSPYESVALEPTELVAVPPEVVRGLLHFSAPFKRAVEQSRNELQRAEALQPGNQPKEPATVLAVFAAKGGVGKSMVAANVAWALASVTGGRVLLWDLDVDFANLAHLLGLDSCRDLSGIDLASTLPDTQRLMSDRIIVPLGAAKGQDGGGTGSLFFMPTLLKPGLAVGSVDATLSELIAVLRRGFHFIVLDTSGNMRLRSELDALKAADKILLVTSPELHSLANTKMCARHLESEAGYDRNKVRIVLNNTVGTSLLDREAIESYLEFKVFAEVPFAPQEVHTAIKTADFVTQFAPDSAVSKAVLDLAARLAGVQGLPPKSQSSSRIKDLLDRLQRSFLSRFGGSSADSVEVVKP
ncbi:MAG: cyclic nucleotide-binding domain-containing protein [Candidatus Riflebacteria bacterium]|nr:cyclic nucleotide-binding domain-containing protein [Candidatus Riflebacteria bacterium]